MHRTFWMAINISGRGTRHRFPSVYHLRGDCRLIHLERPEVDAVELTENEVRTYTKNFGIKRICLVCRKDAARQRPRATGTEKRRP